MGSKSIVVMVGTVRDLAVASKFPKDVKWDKIVKITIPNDHGEFPDMSGYQMADFEQFESRMEDHQLYRYMTQAVDACLDFLTKNANRLELLNFQNIRVAMHGMNTGGSMFVVAGFVDYQPMAIGPRSARELVISPGRN